MSDAVTFVADVKMATAEICPPYKCDFGNDGTCIKCGSHRPPAGITDPK